MQVLVPSIEIDGKFIPNAAARDNYERSVMAVGAKIKSVPFGQAFLDLIANTPNKIVIAPAPDRNQVDTHALDATHAFAPGFGFTNDKGVQFQGAGGGSVTVIDYTPTGNFKGISADTTLIHELCHAWRQARGVWKPLPITNFFDDDAIKNPLMERFRFPNWEEFLGVVVEGLYSSESGSPTARTTQGDFGLFFAMRSTPQKPNIFNPLPMTDSQIFAEKFRRALIRIMSEELDLYRLMLVSRGWFNPVRDMADMARYKRETVVPALPASSIFSAPGSAL